MEVNLDQRYVNLGYTIARQFCHQVAASQVPPDEASALAFQLLCLADSVEREIKRECYILLQTEEIATRALARSGGQFNPQAVELFRDLAAKEGFWLELVSPRLFQDLLERTSQSSAQMPRSSLLALSEFIRQLIEFRSPFTATHSAGVSTAAAALAGHAGFSPADQEAIKIAGNLHGVGKMVVPNRILDKPAALTKEEFAVVRQRTYHTYIIIKRCGLGDGIPGGPVSTTRSWTARAIPSTSAPASWP